MMDLPIPFTEKLPTEQHTAFLKKLTDQIAKDLYPLEWSAVPDEPTPTWIVQKLHKSIEDLLENHSSLLGSILYRIDISEVKIRGLMDQAAVGDRPRVLAQQILEREAQKVWMRMHYSS